MKPDTARIIATVGSIGMLAGALDPMEGSVLILLGSAMLALGTYLDHAEHRVTVYRVWVFIAIAFGVAALWAMTFMGGIGGNSGFSMWWSLLLLPYLIGWSMGIWGHQSHRWILSLGIVVGLWYVTMFGMAVAHGGANVLVLVLAALGVVTIGGCISQLRMVPKV